MNQLTHDETSVTLHSGIVETRIVRNPKHVVARLTDLGIDRKPPIQARRIFHSVCQFYSTLRAMTLVLLADQPVRHEIHVNGDTLTRTGLYRGGVVIWEGKEYTSLSAFALDHYKAVHPTRTTANGWTECQTLIEGKWKRMNELRVRYFKNRKEN